MTLVFLLMMLGGDTAFFQGSLEDALSESKKTGKPVVVDVYTDWCGPCRRMDRTTFRDDTVKSAFQKDVIAIKINAEKGNGPKVARKYKVRAYPSILMLDEEGKVIDRRMGFMNAKLFMNWLNGALPKKK